ncbi:MAG: TolC family protein [Verrucomicrobiae bacterium]|nr:TolC family protein [Verrucomicrobiae bacterium]
MPRLAYTQRALLYSLAAIGLGLSAISLEAAEKVLEIRGAVSQALAANLDLRSAYHEIEMARGRLIQAGRWPNPELEIDAATDRAFNNSGEHRLGVAFTQAFPVTGRLRLAKEVSRVDVAQALAEIRDRERLLIAETQHAYVSVVAAGEQLSTIREARSLNESLVVVSTRRFENAEVSKEEINLAKLQVQASKKEEQLAVATYEAELTKLKLVLGMNAELPLAVQKRLAALSGVIVSSERVSFRPDLRRLELAINRGGSERELAKAERWEDIKVGIGVDSERRLDEPAGLETDRAVGIRLSIPLPLFNRNEGRIAEAEAGMRKAADEYAAKSLTIASEIHLASKWRDRYTEILAEFEKETLPLIGDTAKLLQDAYAQGTADISDAIRAQEQGLELRRSYLEALMNRLGAEIDLQSATGSSPHLNSSMLSARADANQFKRADR